MGFGWTWKADADGELVYDTSTKTLREAVEVEALRQDLVHRLLTIQGEDGVHPLVGIPLLEIMEDSFSRSLIEARFEEQVLADPRVQSVESIEVSDPDQNRSVNVVIAATAIDGTTFTVSTLASLR